MAKPNPLHRSIMEAFGQSFDADEYGREDYDVGEGPGERDFDADEYVESKFPKSANRDGSSDQRTYNVDKTLRQDTPADQARVRRDYEDRAARQADEMMAQYQQQLAVPSAVASRLEDQKAQEETQRRLLAIQWLRGGGQ